VYVYTYKNDQEKEAKPIFCHFECPFGLYPLIFFFNLHTKAEKSDAKDSYRKNDTWTEMGFSHFIFDNIIFYTKIGSEKKDFIEKSRQLGKRRVHIGTKKK